jgi:hypothetical protein
MAVDWPDYLGEPRDLATLARLRNTPDASQAGQMLGTFLPEFDPTTGLSGMLEWAAAGQCTAARLVDTSVTRCSVAEQEPDIRLCAGEALESAALSAFDAEPFDPLNPRNSSALEVGPLALAHPSLARSSGHALSSVGPISRRLLAMVADAWALSRGLPLGADASGAGHTVGRHLGSRTGLGSAQTARGPVFHRVRIGKDDRVQDWRVLAPTDWHFAPNGPVMAAAKALDPNHEALALLVLSYDPCAPWRLVGEGAESRAEHHA